MVKYVEEEKEIYYPGTMKIWVETGDYGETVFLSGWRRMTDNEIEKQKSYDERDKLRREKEKIRNEELEKKQYERLAKKYGKANL